MKSVNLRLRDAIRRAWKEAERRGWDKTYFAVQVLALENSQTLTNWLSRGMPGAELERVADALGWTVDALLGRPTHEVLEWFFKLGPVEQAALLAAIRSKAKGGTDPPKPDGSTLAPLEKTTGAMLLPVPGSPSKH